VGLLGEVREAQAAHRKGLPCSVSVALEGLQGEDRKDFEEALADESIYGSTLSRVLKARGFVVPQESIQRHRRGVCACPR